MTREQARADYTAKLADFQLKAQAYMQDPTGPTTKSDLAAARTALADSAATLKAIPPPMYQG